MCSVLRGASQCMLHRSKWNTHYPADAVHVGDDIPWLIGGAGGSKTTQRRRKQRQAAESRPSDLASSVQQLLQVVQGLARKVQKLEATSATGSSRRRNKEKPADDQTSSARSSSSPPSGPSSGSTSASSGTRSSRRNRARAASVPPSSKTADNEVTFNNRARPQQQRPALCPQLWKGQVVDPSRIGAALDGSNPDVQDIVVPVWDADQLALARGREVKLKRLVLVWLAEDGPPEGLPWHTQHIAVLNSGSTTTQWRDALVHLAAGPDIGLLPCGCKAAAPDRQEDVPPVLLDSVVLEFLTHCDFHDAGWKQIVDHPQFWIKQWLKSPSVAAMDIFALRTTDKDLRGCVRLRSADAAKLLQASGTRGVLWKQRNGPPRTIHWLLQHEGEAYNSFLRRALGELSSHQGHDGLTWGRHQNSLGIRCPKVQDEEVTWILRPAVPHNINGDAIKSLLERAGWTKVCLKNLIPVRAGNLVQFKASPPDQTGTNHSWTLENLVYPSLKSKLYIQRYMPHQRDRQSPQKVVQTRAGLLPCNSGEPAANPFFDSAPTNTVPAVDPENADEPMQGARPTPPAKRIRPALPVVHSEEILRQGGLRPLDTPGDGNCYFHALSACLKNHTHVQVRAKIVSHLRANPWFSRYLGVKTEYTKHVELMAKDKTWGTTVEIAAAAHLASKLMVVITDTQVVAFHPPSVDVSKASPVTLFLHKSHFEPLVLTSNGKTASLAAVKKAVKTDIQFVVVDEQVARVELSSLFAGGGKSSTWSVASAPMVKRSTKLSTPSSAMSLCSRPCMMDELKDGGLPRKSSSKSSSSSSSKLSFCTMPQMRRTRPVSSCASGPSGKQSGADSFDPHAATSSANSAMRAAMARKLASRLDWVCSPTKVSGGWRCSKCKSTTAHLSGLLRNDHSSCGALRKCAPSKAARRAILVEHNLKQVKVDSESGVQIPGVDFTCDVCGHVIPCAGLSPARFQRRVGLHLHLHGRSRRADSTFLHSPMATAAGRAALAKSQAASRDRRIELWKQHGPDFACQPVFQGASQCAGYSVYTYRCVRCHRAASLNKLMKYSCASVPLSETKRAASQTMQAAGIKINSILKEEKAAERKVRSKIATWRATHSILG
eukprot:6483025-Amphidinium_carterae.1